MEWFKLSSDSIGALANLILCLVVTCYLLSLPNKSKESRGITGLFAIYVLVHLTGFFADSTIAPWSEHIMHLQEFIIVVGIIYTLWFIYGYKENLWQKEMRLVLILNGILYVVVMYFRPKTFQWTARLEILSDIWMLQVLLRKMVRASSLGQGANSDSNHRLSIEDSAWRKWSEMAVTELRHPTNRLSKAYRAFVLWGVANLVLSLNGILFITGMAYNYKYWVLVHHAFLLISLIWLAIILINHAAEKTTFLAKLVGLFVCLTLVLEGLIGFLLYDAESSTGISQLYNVKTSRVLIEEQQQRGLRTLAILLPLDTFLIILVTPFFLRSNLLRPLSYVLKGVKRVNEGDLSKDVDVEVNDEVGYLAQSFNHMTASLRRYNNQMESLVADRTTELQNQKEKLQSTVDNLKATQDQLIQSEKMASLGELTAGIAHEIQNPLNFVNNFSEVNTELVDEASQEIEKGNINEVKTILIDIRDNQQKINHHGKRADAIVKGMLQHSRSSSGQKELTDINKLADEYSRLAYHGLRAKDKSFNAKFETNFEENVGKINIIPQDIGRVLLNLINNAFYAVSAKASDLEKTSPDKLAAADSGYQPTVVVSTKKQRDKIEIKVADNGNGIRQKILDKIFQPFFTTKPTGQGTGLGLSLAYDIVKAHGGDINVKTKEGEGSEFIIQLPAV